MSKFTRVGFALAAALLWTTSVSAAEKLSAIASFSILGDVVAEVGGDRIELKTIVGPGGDAHVYQPTPADAGAISRAAVVFVNGLGFEGWINRLIKASGYKGPVVTVTAGIEPLRTDERPEDHHHGVKVTGNSTRKSNDHHHGELDPHVWQNPKNVIVYVANVREALCKADAAGCDFYTRNAAAYTAKLEALDTEIRGKLAAIVTDRRKVITSHDAFGYFAEAYGVKFLAPQGISTESEASAKDVAKLIDQIRQEGVRAVFVENISDTRLISQIARETGAKIGGTLYSDALSGPNGPASTYLDMMRHNANIIAGAIQGS